VEERGSEIAGRRKWCKKGREEWETERENETGRDRGEDRLIIETQRDKG
jgi:hypothetical protein